jgi:hypothetical protein
MGGCLSMEPDMIPIPVPPDGFEEPLSGYEYIPLDLYIVAVEIQKPNQKINKSTVFISNTNPLDDSIFT